MTPLHFLMESVKASPAELAGQIVERGQRYGANKNTLPGAQLRRWHTSTRRVPNWASAAIVDLAIEAGWTIESDEEKRWAVRGFRLGRPDASYADFVSYVEPAIVDQRGLDLAWRKHGQKRA